MAQLPAILRKTLTRDQGCEMANHIATAEAAQLDGMGGWGLAHM